MQENFCRKPHDCARSHPGEIQGFQLEKAGGQGGPDPECGTLQGGREVHNHRSETEDGSLARMGDLTTVCPFSFPENRGLTLNDFSLLGRYSGHFQLPFM